MKGLFLPVGLILSFISAWFIPEPGTTLKEWGLIPWMVITIFLINGYQTNLKEIPRDRSFLSALIFGGIISLIIGPLIGLGVAEVFALPAGLALGLIVKATVPPTLSTCIVMTQLTNGFPLWALVMTVTLNIVGVFTIPFMLGMTLGSSTEITISPLPLLQKLMFLVLLPFIIGLAVKKLSLINPKQILLQYLPSSCVILTVWMALSESHEVLLNLSLPILLKIAGAALTVHLTLMTLSLLASLILKLEPAARLAMLFTISQKTLPVAVSVLTALNLDIPVGEAVLVCVTFHFLMLFTDSLIAPKLKLASSKAL